MIHGNHRSSNNRNEYASKEKLKCDEEGQYEGVSASEHVILSIKESVFRYVFTLLGLKPNRDERDLSKISINFYIFTIDESHLNTREQPVFVTQILMRYQCSQERARD
jgi:hypothetical protein